MADSTTINIPREETMQSILETLQTSTAMQSIMAASSISSLKTDLEGIQLIVKKGLAEDVFEIGDQIVVPYTYNGTEYENVFDIVHFGDVELEDGETLPGMWLQMHYTTIETMPFDYYEAFYYAEDGLEAGVYNVLMGESSNSVVAGDYYYFTLTEDVPAGGVLAGFRGANSSSVSDITTLYVYSYESISATTPIETVSIYSGSSGTNLGTFNITKASDGLNHGHRAWWGYNRWSQSQCRQWLNSAADAGSWWEPQNEYDMQSTTTSTYAGFMAGFDDDFLSIITPIKVTTALNTVEGLDDSYEDTYDTFFLPSLEQIYISPQLSGVEGDYWEYWKRVTNASSAQARSGTYAERISYLLSNHSSAQYVWLRSAHRSTANNVWYVSSSGYVNYYNAYYSRHYCPACVIA